MYELIRDGVPVPINNLMTMCASQIYMHNAHMYYNYDIK